MGLVSGASLLSWISQWAGIYFAHGLRPGPGRLGGAALLLVTVTLAQAFPVLPGNVLVFQAAAVAADRLLRRRRRPRPSPFSVVLQATEAIVGVAVGFLFLIAEGVGFKQLRSRPRRRPASARASRWPSTRWQALSRPGPPARPASQSVTGATGPSPPEAAPESAGSVPAPVGPTRPAGGLGSKSRDAGLGAAGRGCREPLPPIATFSRARRPRRERSQKAAISASSRRPSASGSAA